MTLGVLLAVTLFVAHAPPLLGADADAPEVDALEAAGVTVALDQAAISALARGGNRSDYFEPMALHRWYRAASHKHGRMTAAPSPTAPRTRTRRRRCSTSR